MAVYRCLCLSVILCTIARFRFMRSRSPWSQATLSCTQDINRLKQLTPSMHSGYELVGQVYSQHAFRSQTVQITVEPPLTATSPQRPLFFVPADSPYITSCLNLSTTATSLQRQRPLKCVPNCQNNLSTTATVQLFLVKTKPFFYKLMQ